MKEKDAEYDVSHKNLLLSNGNSKKRENRGTSIEHMKKMSRFVETYTIEDRRSNALELVYL